MISSFIAYALWLSTNPGGQLLSEPSPVLPLFGTSVTHLRNSFDARTLKPGAPLFASVSPLEPDFVSPVFSPTFTIPGLKPSTAVAAVFSHGQPLKAVPIPQTLANFEMPPPVLPPDLTTAVLSATRERAAKKLGKGNRAQVHFAAKAADPEDLIVKNLSLENAPLSGVLLALTKQTGVDFLLIDDSTPTVSINASNRRLGDVLRDLSASSNLSFLKVDNEFVFATDDKLKSAYPAFYAAAHPAPPQPPTPQIFTESYHTDYCDANQLISAIKDQFKAGELTMIAAPAPANQTLGTQDEQSKSGVSASVLTNDDQALKISRLVVVQGERDKVEEAISLMRKLDIAPAQVNIGVTINDISLDAEKDLGVQWQLGNTVFSEQQHSGIGFGSWDRSPLSFQATLQALETQGKDKLLASPNITVLDGQRAYILVGQRLEFPIITSIQQNGQPLYNVQEERVGIYLQVSVWVTNDGKVKLQLYPQVSTVTGFSNINGGSYPQIATREAQTTLTVESGHTIVIGGLIHDEDIENLQRVPILGSIPIFGELFTSHSHSKSRDEVVITITPTISPSQ